jgi:hypothetical protein
MSFYYIKSASGYPDDNSRPNMSIWLIVRTAARQWRLSSTRANTLWGMMKIGCPCRDIPFVCLSAPCGFGHADQIFGGLPHAEELRCLLRSFTVVPLPAWRYVACPICEIPFHHRPGRFHKGVLRLLCEESREAAENLGRIGAACSLMSCGHEIGTGKERRFSDVHECECMTLPSPFAETSQAWELRVWQSAA